MFAALMEAILLIWTELLVLEGTDSVYQTTNFKRGEYMKSVKAVLRLGLCAVFLISITLLYGVNDVSAKSSKKVQSWKKAQTTVIKLWSEGTPAFGSFVFCSELGEDCGISYAQRDLDMVFLDWEHGGYDIAALTDFVTGLDSAEREISFVVRIPPISENDDGVPPISLEVARQYVSEILSVEGVDGVVFPFISSAEDAQLAVSCFTACDADIWSPQNRKGQVISWLMLEGYDAVLDVKEVANTPGISVLVTGVGSLTGVIGPEAGELGLQLVLAHTTRVGVPNVGLAYDYDDLINRIDEGFLGHLMFSPETDAWIHDARIYVEEREFDEKEFRISTREIRNWWKRLLKDL